MKAQLRVLSGPRKGMSGVFSHDTVSLGRHPDCDFQLDPDHDLEVSARHALLVRGAERWSVRDVGSRNGTLLNGHPLSGDTPLSDTDQIRLGADGPHLEFRLVPDNTPDHRPAPPRAAPVDADTGQRVTQDHHVTPARQSTTQRIRLEVGRQTRRLRTLTVVLFVLLIGSAAVFLWDTRRQTAVRTAEVAAMQARIDSILAESEAALGQLRGQVEGLATALQRSQTDVQRLQTELRTAERTGDDQQIAVLRRQLESASAALRNQQAAAQVDYTAINEANQYAVAMLWAEFPDGSVLTGTAFAVTPDGRMVTNRHVVAGPEGVQRARRLAIQFTNSTQVWRASVERISTDPAVDLAIVRVQGVAGAVPTVQALADAPPGVGEPVAIIGFPHGDDLPMRARGERPIIRTSFNAGIVSKVTAELVQLDGYGAEGASGSPIFDRAGHVVAVLYGGQPGTDGRVVFSVPVTFVRSLLAGR